MPTYTILAQILAKNPRKIVRFPDIPVDEALSQLNDLERKLEESAEKAAQLAAQAPAALGAAVDGLADSLSTLATQVWRAKSKMVDPTSGEPRDEMRRAYRHVEGALEAFDHMGVTMSDWVNQPYDAGLPVKALTFQPTAGLSRDTVVETVRPTIIWKGRVLQIGEVVVGIPAGGEEAAK